MRRRAIQALAPQAFVLLLGAAGPALAEEPPPGPPAAPPTGAPTGAPTSILPDVFEAPTAVADGVPERAAPILPPDALSVPVARRPAPDPAAAAAAAVAAAQAAAEAAAEAAEAEERRFGPFRPAADAGLLSEATLGLGGDLFGGSDGRFLAALLNRLEGPLALRWGQILVQRALLSAAAPPPGIHPGDWLAARARGLVAIGAAADAHRMLARVRLADYTPRLFAAAAHAALAAGDPMGLCPIAAEGRTVSGDNAAFVLADAWCAAAGGDAASANLLLEEARDDRIADPFDIQLAERIASLAGGTRGAGNPVWSDVGSLTAWRVGLATAAGLAIPEPLLEAASPVVRGWRVRMAGLSPEAQAALAPEATALGLLSGAEVRRIFARAADGAPAGAVEETPGGRLRVALMGPDAETRLAALRTLWASAPEASVAAYGWQVATAAAAARIAPDPARAGDAPALLQAMLAGGYTGNAARWWPTLSKAEEETRDRAALLIAAIDETIPVTAGALDRLALSGSAHRAALARAGLLGLGRMVPGDPLPALDNGWTRALEAAVAGRRRGEILVLAATGLQGPLADLAPDHLRRIVSALVAAGLGAEAELLVAEAISRG